MCFWLVRVERNGLDSKPFRIKEEFENLRRWKEGHETKGSSKEYLIKSLCGLREESVA